MGAIIDYVDLIGVKFAYGGRGPDSYDCLGLVMECHRRLGMDIPDYRSPTILAEIALLIAQEREKWTLIARKTPGAEPISSTHLTPGRTIELRIQGLACHIGFIHRKRRFIHASEGTNSVVDEQLYDWRDRIVGVYEFAG
jgi:hypothetical protein